MNYAVEMGSGAKMYILIFRNIGSGIQKLTARNSRTQRHTDTDTQTEWRCKLYFIFQNKEGRLRILLNYENHTSYVSPIKTGMINSRMRWSGHVAQMGEKRNSYRIFVGNPERKRPLGRPRRRCVDYIKMDLGEKEWVGMDWIHLAQDSDRWRAYGNGNELSGSIKCWEILQ
jgi:hypothetical protein